MNAAYDMKWSRHRVGRAEIFCIGRMLDKYQSKAKGDPRYLWMGCRIG
jgi:hypothetical protein